MCPDCQRRINTNPMRILDCKTDRGLIVDEVEVMKNAPKINDYLTDEAREYFNDVVNTLKSFDIDFDVDYNLVRGLDYYTDTVFEFIIESDDELNGLALGGGGKYADMIKSMVGIDVPGIGYAMGVDRLISVMEAQDLFKDIDPVVDAVIIGLDKESKKYGLDLAVKLRAAGITCEMDYKNLNMKPQFKLCDKLNPRFIIIIGEEERMSGNLSVKNASTKTQELVNVEKIIDYIRK
jgi:histidyl-tRNA synthetase